MQIVLNFHGIGPPGQPPSEDEARYWLTPEHFGALLDAALAWGAGRDIAFTFDDGNRSDVTIALPELRRRGLVGHFFVLSGRLGRPGYLSDKDLRVLAEAGMTVGSHGADHVDWRKVSDEALENEISGAREAIAKAAGRPVEEAAIPFGSYDRRVIRQLRRAGYRVVYSSDGAPAKRHAWFRPRLTLRADTSPTDLERVLSRSWSLARLELQRAKIALKRFR